MNNQKQAPGLNRAPQVLLSSHRNCSPASTAHTSETGAPAAASRSRLSAACELFKGSTQRQQQTQPACGSCTDAVCDSFLSLQTCSLSSPGDEHQQTAVEPHAQLRDASPTPRRCSPLPSRASLSASTSAARLERVASVPAVQLLLLARSPRHVLPPLCPTTPPLTRPSLWLRETVGQRRVPCPVPSASAPSPLSPSRLHHSLRAFTPLQPPAARIARRREPVRRPAARTALCAARDWAARSARAALRRARAGAHSASTSTCAARLTHAAQQSSLRASTARGILLADSVTSINSYS